MEKAKSTLICNRKNLAVIARLRLGHCGLRSGLVLTGKHPDSKCGGMETVRHILLQCKKDRLQRRKMLRDLLFALYSLQSTCPGWANCWNICTTLDCMEKYKLLSKELYKWNSGGQVVKTETLFYAMAKWGSCGPHTALGNLHSVRVGLTSMEWIWGKQNVI